MFHTGVRRSLTARHFLAGDFGDESVPHAHPYEVELICASGELDANGFSTDIAAMETVLERELARIDNVLLNDLAFFSDKQPSLENLAVYLAGAIRGGLREQNAEPSQPIEIKIWEAPTAWASFVEPGA